MEEQKTEKKAQPLKAVDKKSTQKSLFEKVGSRLKDCQGEFRKIIWPSRKELIKQTVTVIVTSLLIGVVIMVMDFAFGYGQQMFAKLIG